MNLQKNRILTFFTTAIIIIISLFIGYTHLYRYEKAEISGQKSVQIRTNIITNSVYVREPDTFSWISLNVYITKVAEEKRIQVKQAEYIDIGNKKAQAENDLLFARSTMSAINTERETGTLQPINIPGSMLILSGDGNISHFINKPRSEQLNLLESYYEHDTSELTNSIINYQYQLDHFNWSKP